QLADDAARQKKLALAAASQTEGEIATEIKAARAAVAAHAKTARGQAQVQASLSFGQLLAATTEQVDGLTKSKTAHQEAARKQVTDRQEAARLFGASEGKRGREAIEAQVKDALTRGQTKAKSYAADERGQVQAAAVMKVAQATAAELQKPAQSIEEKAIEQGNDLADGFSGAGDKAVEAIEDQAPQLAQQLMTAAAGQLPAFKDVGEAAGKAIDSFAADVATKLDGVENDAR